jgi:hypothetical protein
MTKAMFDIRTTDDALEQASARDTHAGNDSPPGATNVAPLTDAPLLTRPVEITRSKVVRSANYLSVEKVKLKIGYEDQHIERNSKRTRSARSYGGRR